MSVKGIPQLKARLEAIAPNPDFMRKLALVAVAEQKRLVPRRTGNLGRSIGIERVTATSADTVAHANYALFVERGTKAHTIVPRNRKALRWPAAGSSTLGGRVRSGGSVIFAKRVRHPGTRARPFMEPGAKRAVDKLGVDVIVKAWNDAA